MIICIHEPKWMYTIMIRYCTLSSICTRLVYSMYLVVLSQNIIWSHHMTTLQRLVFGLHLLSLSLSLSLFSLSLSLSKPEVQSWDLQSLLIKPIQRLLKYLLLLEKLLQATPKDHPNHKILSFAIKLSL